MTPPAPSLSSRLAGKVLLVTGASSGVGRAVALRSAREGGVALLTGRSGERLEAVAAEIRNAGGQASCCAADLTRAPDLDRLVQRAAEQGPGLDGLVHCAGAIALGALEHTDAATLARMLAINLEAPLHLTRRLLPLLRARRGQVVFVNSSAALTAGPTAGAYAASKAALHALANSLRDEVNDLGIRVTSLFLGRTATPMQQAVHEQEGRPYRPERLLQPEDVAELLVAALALPETAEVTEIRLRPAHKPSP